MTYELILLGLSRVYGNNIRLMLSLVVPKVGGIKLCAHFLSNSRNHCPNQLGTL